MNDDGWFGCVAVHLQCYFSHFFRHFCGSKHTSRSGWIHAMVPVTWACLGKGFAAFWRGYGGWGGPEPTCCSNISGQSILPLQSTSSSSFSTFRGARQQLVVKISWPWWRWTFLFPWWISIRSISLKDTFCSYGQTRHAAKITAFTWHQAQLQ